MAPPSIATPYQRLPTLPRQGLRLLAEGPDPSQLGARLDPLPAVTCATILLGALALRMKIQGAIAARDRAVDAKATLDAYRVAALSGTAVEDLQEREREVAALFEEAERARTLEVAGLRLRFMVPLPLGSSLGTAATAAPEGTGENQRRAPRAGGGAPGGTLIAVAVGAVLFMQLCLLALLATDPVDPSHFTGTGAFR